MFTGREETRGENDVFVFPFFFRCWGEGFLCVAFGLKLALLRWGRRLRATRRPDHAIRLTAGPGSVASAIRGLPPVKGGHLLKLVLAVKL